MRKPKAASSWRLWPLLMLAPLAAYGRDQPEPAESAPEFIDFLEYLGSWDGNEQDWVQFIEPEERAPRRDASGIKPDEHEDKDDVVS